VVTHEPAKGWARFTEELSRSGYTETLLPTESVDVAEPRETSWLAEWLRTGEGAKRPSLVYMDSAALIRVRAEGRAAALLRLVRYRFDAHAGVSRRARCVVLVSTNVKMQVQTDQLVALLLSTTDAEQNAAMGVCWRAHRQEA